MYEYVNLEQHICLVWIILVIVQYPCDEVWMMTHGVRHGFCCAYTLCFDILVRSKISVINRNESTWKWCLSRFCCTYTLCFDILVRSKISVINRNESIWNIAVIVSCVMKCQCLMEMIWMTTLGVRHGFCSAYTLCFDILVRSKIITLNRNVIAINIEYLYNCILALWNASVWWYWFAASVGVHIVTAAEWLPRTRNPMALQPYVSGLLLQGSTESNVQLVSITTRSKWVHLESLRDDELPEIVHHIVSFGYNRWSLFVAMIVVLA